MSVPWRGEQCKNNVGQLVLQLIHGMIGTPLFDKIYSLYIFVHAFIIYIYIYMHTYTIKSHFIIGKYYI